MLLTKTTGKTFSCALMPAASAVSPFQLLSWFNNLFFVKEKGGNVTSRKKSEDFYYRQRSPHVSSVAKKWSLAESFDENGKSHLPIFCWRCGACPQSDFAVYQEQSFSNRGELENVTSILPVAELAVIACCLFAQERQENGEENEAIQN